MSLSDAWDSPVTATVVVVAGLVALAVVVRGCDAKGEEEKTKRDELRQRSFQVCVQAGRDADECKRGLP